MDEEFDIKEMADFINSLSEDEFKNILDDTEREMFGGKTIEELK